MSKIIKEAFENLDPEAEKRIKILLAAGGYLPPPPERSTKKNKREEENFIEYTIK